MQIIRGESLQLKAVDQWTRELPIIAERGQIYDRNGVLLVGNEGTFSVFCRRRSLTNPKTASKYLSEILEMDEKGLYKKLTGGSSGEITLKRNVGKDKIDKLLEYSIDGVYFARDNKRVYPYNEMLCQILGYTSSDGRGIAGLELYYDEYLHGIDGEIMYESDLTGVDLKSGGVKYRSATKGLNLKLTIDVEIQKIIESVMQKAFDVYTPKSASAIVINPNNGEVLGIATKPSFNLNEVPKDDIDLLNKMSRSPIIVDSYEPGSTFKVLTASADIEEYYSGNKNAFSENHIFSSSRYRYVAGGKIKCWSNHANGKHSEENLSMALNNSCNPVFVDIALSLGKKSYYKYVNLFNYGKVTGIDLSGEAAGMVLPESAVTEGDLARISFGQTIAVTPLQLAMATASMVNGGKYYTPHFLSEIYSTDGELYEKVETKLKNTTISEKTSKIISGYLEDVVAKGSGKQCYIEGYRVGGKTGTAQKYENGVIAQGKWIMSFIGFFPADMPEYLCLVTVDEPVGGQYGSTVAAPLCKDIFEGIIKLKNITPCC